MPVYDYGCKECGEVFEVRASIKEREAGLVLECPKCGSHDARQRLTLPSVLLGGMVSPTPGCGPRPSSGCCG